MDSAVGNTKLGELWELGRVAIVVSCMTTVATLSANFSHINAEWRRVGGWESPELLLLLLSHLLSLSLTLEFATAFSKLQRWRSVIPSHPKRKLYDKKKKCLTSLSWSHLLSKCWSALTCSWSAVQSWNSTLEWSLVGSKTQPKDKETRTSQETDLWLLFF